MLIIPAIDLIEGKCVRLTEGEFDGKKIYSYDPIGIASVFKKSGAKRIHIVDLDGAKSGESKNREIIKKIKKEVGIEVETGGGIRSKDDVKDLIVNGIDYLILGTVLAENLEEVKKWIKEFGVDKFIAGIDVKDNIVKTRGWIDDKGLDAFNFGRQIFDLGFKNAVYTDISKDGKLEGPNIDATKAFIDKTGLNVILSGGISSIKDVKKAVKKIKSGLNGIIIGKAYYEGRIDIIDTINKFQDKE